MKISILGDGCFNFSRARFSAIRVKTVQMIVFLMPPRMPLPQGEPLGKGQLKIQHSTTALCKLVDVLFSEQV
jgi:hypothetical protein